jgi:hypothetical protein
MRPIATLTLILAFWTIVPADSADLVVVNADVFTRNGSPKAEAFAVRGGEFVFVGSNEGAAAFFGPGAKRIDAGGRLVVPGFNDSHVHLYNTGIQFFSLDLRPATTVSDALARIREFDRYLPPGEWIRGSGWDASNAPTAGELDAAAPERPIFIYGRDPAFAIASSTALRLAGIPDAKLPLERAGLAQVRKTIAQTPNRSAVLETAVRFAVANGVTSIQDVSSDDIAGDLRDLERFGKLPVRVYDCVGLDKPLPKVDRDPAKRVRTGCLKHFADTDAAEALAKRLADADRSGVQLLLHAIGPKANDAALSIFERVARLNGRRDRRLRIEHAHGLRPADFARARRLDAIASMQPALFADRSPVYAETFTALRGSAIRLAFGSDAAMIPIDPISGILSATDRRHADSFRKAIEDYTAGSAFAEFQDNRKGGIEVGYLADFVILTGTGFSGVRSGVAATFIDGELVFKRSDTEVDGL